MFPLEACRMKTLAFYSGNNLTPDYGDKFVTLDYKIIWRRRNSKVHEDLIKLSAIQLKNKAEWRCKTRGTVGHHILTGIDGNNCFYILFIYINQENFCMTSSSTFQLTWNEKLSTGRWTNWNFWKGASTRKILRWWKLLLMKGNFTAPPSVPPDLFILPIHYTG